MRKLSGWTTRLRNCLLVLLMVTMPALTGSAHAAATSCSGEDDSQNGCQSRKQKVQRKYVSVPVPERPGKQVRPSTILKEKFTQLSNAQGRWEGYIASVGTTHLRLVFLKNGSILGSRYIGSVTRQPAAKPTPFKFVSALPDVRGWSWKIVAGTF